MTLAEQYDDRRARALLLLNSGFSRAEELHLVNVRWPGLSQRISIVGSAISHGAVDVWRHQGAGVYVIEVVRRGDE